MNILTDADRTFFGRQYTPAELEILVTTADGGPQSRDWVKANAFLCLDQARSIGELAEARNDKSVWEDPSTWPPSVKR